MTLDLKRPFEDSGMASNTPLPFCSLIRLHYDAFSNNIFTESHKYKVLDSSLSLEVKELLDDRQLKGFEF